MRTRVPLAAATLLLATGLLACGRARPREPQPTTVLEVTNQSSLDVTVYVLRGGGGDRTRLGVATAHLQTNFVIPPNLIHGITPLRFRLDPIGARAQPLTEEIVVRPGDTVVLNVPP